MDRFQESFNRNGGGFSALDEENEFGLTAITDAEIAIATEIGVSEESIEIPDLDRDKDGVPNSQDIFPDDGSESSDVDQDGVGDRADTDDDNDQVNDAMDAFPLDSEESVDTDGDGIGNNADIDDDGDGVADTVDVFPLDSSEALDSDGDGVGNNADVDDDGDEVVDTQDAFPLDKNESIDTDGDGVGNSADSDDDGDNVSDTEDTFPLDGSESVDTDTDGIGDNADGDDDNDGVADSSDAFPLDANESTDTDGDGTGDNADNDDDNDGSVDVVDEFPLDPLESVDTDNNGIGDNADKDDDGDGVTDALDAFPLDASESADTDLDGIGNNVDTDDDNDNVLDTEDALPLDPTESIDTDNDGRGNNADTDDDNDGILDTADDYPLKASDRVAASLRFPLDPATGTVKVVSAFPNLDFKFAVYVTNAGDDSDRLFVVLQTGQIHVFNNDPGVATTEIFLDISSVITAGGELGLLGLAFSPNYKTDGYFYVYYTAESPLRSVIARYKVSDSNANQADPDSALVILEIDQPFRNHNGGTIAFGPDGYLYVGLGDGGSGGDPLGSGQNKTTLLGAMLRIEPDGSPYRIPADNPFVGDGGSVREEIWAYGFRNPYRFSFDRLTGDLWLADVGQDLWEEIDVLEKGGNYGWNIFEGNHEYVGGSSDSLKFPIFEYDHSVGTSITGGIVYRGPIVELQGAYIYADFASTGKVFALFADRNNNYETILNEQISTGNFNISSIGEDEAGEAYILSYIGTLYKFEPSDAGSVDPIPALLSDTGIFQSPVSSLSVNPGMIEYDVNTPLWSDHAIKRRWLSLPDLSDTITFANIGGWQFPLGSVMVKHFEMQMDEDDANSIRKLETRVLLKQSSGWKGFTYKWRSDESDADLLASAQTELLTITTSGGGTREQSYHYPSSAQCISCHTQIDGQILGVRTKQLNRVFSGESNGENQLDKLARSNYFSSIVDSNSSYAEMPSLDHPTANASEKSRAYLDANCAFCHQSGGATPVLIDLRSEIIDAAMNAIGISPSVGNLGIIDAEIIKAANKEESILWRRMNTTDTHRMPPLGTSVVHEEAVDTIGEWIDGL